MSNIYENGLGDELINQKNYNDEIKSYLYEEGKIISKIIVANSVIIEVGCMHGRLLEEVFKQGNDYIGIDNSSAYIKEGNEKFKFFLNNQYQLIIGNSEELHKIEQIKSIKQSINAVLIFPFNSFGNISNSVKAIKSISETGLPFYLFTYQCNSKATNSRIDYYQRSGFTNIQVCNISKGIQIKDNFGLNSIAYKESWLLKEFKKYNIDIYPYNFGEIGIFFSNGKIII